VAATDARDVRASFSNANSDVEIAAPGVNVLSTKRGGGYVAFSGTSMATPHVAGIIALMLEANPNLTPAQVKDILKRTATNMTGRLAWEAGAGHVNTYEAVSAALGLRTDYGATVNSLHAFNSNALLVKGADPVTYPADVVVAALGFTADLGPLESWGLKLSHRANDTTGAIQVLSERNDGLTITGTASQVPTALSFACAAAAIICAVARPHPGSWISAEATWNIASSRPAASFRLLASSATANHGAALAGSSRAH